MLSAMSYRLSVFDFDVCHSYRLSCAFFLYKSQSSANEGVRQPEIKGNNPNYNFREREMLCYMYIDSVDRIFFEMGR